MVTDKMSARIAGVCYITATAAPTLTYIFGEALVAPDYLVAVSASEIQMLGVLLLEIIWALAVVGIPVMLFPNLKTHDERLALGWFSLRLIEAISTALGGLGLLALLSLSQAFVQAGAPAASSYQVLGALLLAARDWNLWLTLTVFSVSAVILNYLLYQSKLVPRWLSGWGFLGGALLVVLQVLELIRIDLLILNFPIMIQEMVFAVWLLVKGLNTRTNASESS